MKKVIIIPLLFISSLSLFSENLKITKTVFSPRDFYVGDIVTVHVHIETPFDGELEAPEIIPESDWIDINNINLIYSGGEEAIVRISFRSYASGLRVVPDIMLGKHVLHDLRIPTLSILKDQFDELQPLAPQMTPAGTNLLVVLVLLGVVVGPYILFLVIRTIIHSIKLAIKKYKREKPFRDYLKVLKQLKNDQEESGVRGFYVSITEQLRTYLSVRFNREFSSATTMEMEDMLNKIMDIDSAKELLSICKFADLVKFSHSDASPSHRNKDLKTIVEILFQLEGKDKKYARI